MGSLVVLRGRHQPLKRLNPELHDWQRPFEGLKVRQVGDTAWQVKLFRLRKKLASQIAQEPWFWILQFEESGKGFVGTAGVDEGRIDGFVVWVVWEE